MVVEAVCASGTSIQPIIILKAAMHQAAWYQYLPPNWSIAVSENGWTTNEIGLRWLDLLNKHTKDHVFGTHRHLILDAMAAMWHLNLINNVRSTQLLCYACHRLHYTCYSHSMLALSQYSSNYMGALLRRKCA
jgi:hypothetical protein